MKMGTTIAITGRAMIQNLSIRDQEISRRSIPRKKGHAHNITVAMHDRPHIFEIHTLHMARRLIEYRTPIVHGGIRTKYPVRRVSGRKMMVASVSRRLTHRLDGQSASTSRDL